MTTRSVRRVVRRLSNSPDWTAIASQSRSLPRAVASRSPLMESRSTMRARKTGSASGAILKILSSLPIFDDIRQTPPQTMTKEKVGRELEHESEDPSESGKKLRATRQNESGGAASGGSSGTPGAGCGQTLTAQRVWRTPYTVENTPVVEIRTTIS